MVMITTVKKFFESVHQCIKLRKILLDMEKRGKTLKWSNFSLLVNKFSCPWCSKHKQRLNFTCWKKRQSLTFLCFKIHPWFPVRLTLFEHSIFLPKIISKLALKHKASTILIVFWISCRWFEGKFFHLITQEASKLCQYRHG